MIATNELRVGNYYLHDGKITKVTESDLAIIFELKTYSDFKPIPLTPEILEKCGFKLVSKHSFWNFQNKNGFYVSMWMEDEPMAGFEKKGCCYTGESYTEISTVHWLQNYYFFNYRKELEINLNNQP